MAVDLADVVDEKLAGATRVVIGVSGGVDSMVLADILSRRPSVAMICAHVDHQIRPESSSDANFVREWCNQRSIQCEVVQLDQCPKGVNFEAWARRERYTFFNKICHENSCQVILTAHHADDVVETLLMRLCANKELRSIDERNQAGGIVRPLLTCTKAEIVKYALDHSVLYVEDATNTNQRFLRNKFRHTILPFLRNEFGSTLDGILFEQACSLDNDLRYLRESADELACSLEATPRHSREWLRQCRALLGAAPKVLRWRIVEYLLIEDLGFRAGRRHSERFVIFVLGEQTGIELPGGVTIGRKKGGLERIPSPSQKK